MAKDRERWRAAVPGVAKSWTQLSNWTATKHDTDELIYGTEVDSQTLKTYVTKGERGEG